MLQISNLSLNYDGVNVLRKVDLTIAAGEVVIVLGPNGAGKSSLLKVASGEIRANEGSVLFQGRPLRDWALNDKARKMAVLPQQSLLNFPYSVTEVVLLGRTPHDSGVRTDNSIVDQVLKAVDAEYLKGKIYTHLSGGEKQRVQLARVLAQQWPTDDDQERLLILDEPTSALDYSHQKMVAAELIKLARNGGSVVTAMHDLNLAASCADKMVLMCCGEVRACGTPDSVLQTELLKEVFEVDFHRLEHPVTGRPWLIS